MIRMYPKAVVLTAHHPYGGTEMMGQSLVYALNANGYDAVLLSVSDQTAHRIPALMKDPDLRLVMTTGTLPLRLTVDEIPVWKMVRPDVDFITYIIDAWPYDIVRVAQVREYVAAWQTQRNLHIASLEGNDAKLIGPRAHHMPTGAYGAPWRDEPKQHPDRLMIWASTHTELAVSPLHSAFEDTLAENNPWGFDAPSIVKIGEALRHTNIVHGLSAMADAMRMPLPELMQPEFMTALCAIDSCMKRYRRVKVVTALRNHPVDIYGANWEPYVAGSTAQRIRTANPNHNHAFSHICQHYQGVFNFDPNFGNGTNERAVSALALGIPIANNFNRSTDALTGVYPYHFSDESIRHAADRLLAHRDAVPTPVGNTWEHLVGGLLRRIAAEQLALHGVMKPEVAKAVEAAVSKGLPTPEKAAPLQPTPPTPMPIARPAPQQALKPAPTQQVASVAVPATRFMPPQPSAAPAAANAPAVAVERRGPNRPFAVAAGMP
jgi:hypothetical protein